MSWSLTTGVARKVPVDFVGFEWRGGVPTLARHEDPGQARTGISVGAITVQFAATTFEVATAAVPSFVKRVKAPDRRDPHLVISLDGKKPVRSVGDRDASGEG